MRRVLVPVLAAAFGLCLPATLTAAEAESAVKRPEMEARIKAKGPAAADHAKHLQRIATIDRLEAIAKEQNNTALLEQVTKMRAQEATRHARVQAAHGKGKRPEHAGKPDGAGKPDKAGKPDEEKKPDAGKPDAAGKPDKAGKPDAGKPDAAGKPDMAGKPDKAGKPDGEKKPDAGKPDAAGKPAQVGQPTDQRKPAAP